MQLTCRNPVEDEQLSHSAAECHAHPIKELLLRVKLQIRWNSLSIAEIVIRPRHNRNLRKAKAKELIQSYILLF